jgi:hypothetical protein
MCIIVGFLLGFFAANLYNSKDSLGFNTQKIYELMNNNLGILFKLSPEPYILHDTLKHEFPNQTNEFFKSIISSYDYSIRKRVAPSIIMLVSDKLTSENTKCVARKLLKILINKKSDKNCIIDTKKLSDMEHEAAKEVLDGDLINIFTNLSEKFALVEDIQLIPAKSMLLFHSYGDDDSTAKYKGIITLLTFEIDEDISEDREKFSHLASDYAVLSKFVENKLGERLSKNMHADQLYPLYTRISNNIILVNNEDCCK